jgi:hypothetical protein
MPVRYYNFKKERKKMTKFKNILVIVFVIALSMSMAVGQDDNPTGWSFGGVPAVAYNSDTGFLYGAILDIYNYGDGSKYPNYLYTTRLHNVGYVINGYSLTFAPMDEEGNSRNCQILCIHRLVDVYERLCFVFNSDS